MRAPAASWDRIFEMHDRLACQFAELLGTLTERGKDYKSALDAIARGRAALAEPLPAPRCERTSWLRAAVREMAELGVLHYADNPSMHAAHPGLKGIIRLEKLRAASRDQRAFQAQNAGFESPAAIHT